MRKMIPLLLSAAALLGGCASGYSDDYGYRYPGGGYNYPQGGSGYPQGGYGYPSYGYGNQNFEQAAVNACSRQASRFGRVGIGSVERRSGSTVRVYGTIEGGYGGYGGSYDRRTFQCSFRSDGRITDFDTDRTRY